GRPAARASGPRCRRTRCATRSRAICSSAARTSAPCRRCSGTSTSRPPRSTRTCRRAWSTTCIAASTRAPGARARGARAEMARPGHRYPQVEPGARSLAVAGVVACASGTPVSRALARARAAGAGVIVSGPRQAVPRAELARAAEWGLGARPVREVAWTDLPVLAETATESEARRLAQAGASLVLLRRGARIVAAIDAAALAPAPPESSMLARLERAGDRVSEARLWLLSAAGKLGESMGTPVHAVGGLVRDLLLGFAPPEGHTPDVDLVVEGDGIALARRLGEEIGGTVLMHAGFGTASIEGGHAPAGARLGRVDIASARRERYARPGALPEVAPAGLLEDLRRRDFSVNAMAMALAPDRFGH